MTTLAATTYAPMPTATSHHPRIRILDGLRLVAALLVVSWHYVAFGHGASLTPYAQVPALYPVAAYGWLGVELFFLISGFVICMSSIGHTLGEFVTSRITRLYPAYWFAIVLTTAVLLLWPGQSALPWSDVAVNFTMFQSGYDLPSVDAVYWTLWIELHFYVLFAIVVWRGANYRRVATFCGAWLVASVIGRELGGKWDTMPIADYAPFFVAGVAFYLMRRYGSKPLLWVYVVASYALGVPPVLRTLDGSNTHLHAQIAQWPAVVALAVFYLLVGAIALGWLKADWKWLGVAGAMTYPLYLVHEFIGWAILKSLDDTVPGPVLFLGTLALMLVVAWLINRYVERRFAPTLKRWVRAALGAPVAVLRWARTRARPVEAEDQPPTPAGTRSMTSLNPGPVSIIVTGAPVTTSTCRINSDMRAVMASAVRAPRIDGS